MNIVLALLLAARMDAVVGGGGTSNPFELPRDPVAADAETAQPGAFVVLRTDAEASTSPLRRVRIGVDGGFGGDFFVFVAQRRDAQATRARDATSWGGRLGAPIRVDATPSRWSAARALFELEPFFGVHRSTFTSHRTGRRFVTTGDVDLGDRYDTNTAGLGSHADFLAGSSVAIRAGARIARVDYVDDFEDAPQFDSWDYTERRAGVDVLSVPRELVLLAGYEWTVREYDERFPRDRNGDSVLPGTTGYSPQVFTYHRVRAKAGWSGDRLRAVARGGLGRRIDEYSGYLSYTEATAGLEIELRTSSGWTFRVDPDVAYRRYDGAKVNYDPLASEIERRRIEVEGAVEWPVTGRASGFLEVQFVDQAATNALYTFHALRGTTGIRVSLR